MAPKTQTNVLRGRGRPKKPAAPLPAPVAIAPAKRGRVAKVDAVATPAETPRKRGRPSKAQVEELVAVSEPSRRDRRSLVVPKPPVEEALTPKKRVGRPPRAEVAKVPAPTPKNRVGRPSKVDAPALEEVPATPKRRGRPAKNAATLDLSRVVGSSRVTKSCRHSAPKSNTTAAAPRLNPRLRSKLRTRLPPAQKAKEEIAPQPVKRRGRPPKAAATPAPPPKKAPGSKATVSKPSAPRKKRGYTVLEIPDNFVAQVQQYLQEIQDADSLPTPIEDGVEDMVEDEAEKTVEDGAEDIAETEAGAEEEEEDDIEAGADEVEEDRVMFAEEDGMLNNASAAEQENILAMAEQAQEYDDADMDLGAQEDDDSEDEGAQQVIILEDVEDAPTNVDIGMSIQETVQFQQIDEDAHAPALDLDEITEVHEDDISLMNNANMDAYLRDADSRAAIGTIFG
jgi:hypothetical protein